MIFDLNFQKVCKRFADFLKFEVQNREFFSPYFRICRLFLKKNGKMQFRKNGEKNSRFSTSIFKISANSPIFYKFFRGVSQKKKNFFFKEKEKIYARAIFFTIIYQILHLILANSIYIIRTCVDLTEKTIGILLKIHGK